MKGRLWIGLAAVLAAVCYVGLRTSSLGFSKDRVAPAPAPAPAPRASLRPAGPAGHRVENEARRVRSHAAAVVPHGELAELVSDGELACALSAAVPHWRPLRTATTLHALRLWGLASEFPPGFEPPPGPSGRRFLEILTDDAAWKSENPDSEGQFLLRTPYGIRVSVAHEALSGSLLGAGHVDQLLSAFADAGVPLCTAIVPGSGDAGTVEDLLADSMMRFSAYQEMEFTASSFARWLSPPGRWKNRFGETYSLEMIANVLCEGPLGSGACDGTHVPYAAAILLGVDRGEDLLSDEVSSALVAYLKECTLALEANELPAGGWDADWGGSRRAHPPGEQSWSNRFERISNTGHHLEWIALAPSECRPSAAVVRRAVASLSREIESLTLEERKNFKHFWPLSHAARALVLLRSVDAFDAWRKLDERKEIEG